MSADLILHCQTGRVLSFTAGEGSLGLGPPTELLVDSLQRVGGAQRLPLRDREIGV